MGTKRTRARFYNTALKAYGRSVIKDKVVGNGISSIELRELSVENQYLADLQAALRIRRSS